MKYAYWGFAMLLFGAIGLIVIVMFESITLNNDSVYYNLKEAMEASMYESVDVSCYRIAKSTDLDGSDKQGCDADLKIVEQKFVENFTRRFVESLGSSADNFDLEFYDIMEAPPKASVKIISHDGSYKLVSDSVDISNGLSGILETNTKISNVVNRKPVDFAPTDVNVGFDKVSDREGSVNSFNERVDDTGNVIIDQNVSDFGMANDPDALSNFQSNYSNLGTLQNAVNISKNARDSAQNEVTTLTNNLSDAKKNLESDPDNQDYKDAVSKLTNDLNDAKAVLDAAQSKYDQDVKALSDFQNSMG